MLLSLDIENIAVIQKAAIEFGDGFNIVTGETGAGKSLLINSLGMVLGFRSNRDMIRGGQPYARVSAVFFDNSFTAILDEMGIDCEDGSLVITRKLFPDGRNICHINGFSVNVSTLRQIGKKLVSMHAQHDSEVLFDEGSHLDFIDEFISIADLLSDYREAYKEYKNSKARLDSLSSDSDARRNEADYLSYQIRQIDNACLSPDEEDALISERKKLQNAQRLRNLCASSLEALSKNMGAKELLGSIMHDMQELNQLDEQCNSFCEKASELFYEADELSRDLNEYSFGIDASDGRLNEICDRLDEINSLKRKFNMTVPEILSYRDESAKKLDMLAHYDENTAQLEAQVKSFYEIALNKARHISQIRKSGAKKLCERLCGELRELDMQKCTVVFDFSPCELSLTGIDSVVMLISTNPAEEPKPLSKIASGGEMNRIMLAFKTVFCDYDTVPTLLFDEIDTGVSGRAAEKIATKMHSLSEKYQLICVSHLPSVAAAAQSHILIEKDTSQKEFTTHISRIEGKDRVREIARIISGDSVDEVSLENAKRMLELRNGELWNK